MEEEEAFEKLYQDYLELVFETSEYEIGEKTETRDLALSNRNYKIEYEGNNSIIKDNKDNVIMVVNNRHVYESGYPGIFAVKKKYDPNSIFSPPDYYIDFNGNVVKELRSRFNTSVEYTYGISRKGLFGEKKYFFNDATGKYFPLEFKPLVFEYEYEYGQYGDYTGKMAIFMENKDYKLFIDDDGKIFLFKKFLGTYMELPYNKTDKQNNDPEKDFIALDINFDKNIMKINDTYYYLTPSEVIDISEMMKNKKWSRSIRINPLKETIMSFSEFKSRMQTDKRFMVLLREEIKEIKNKKLLKEVKNIELADQEETMSLFKEQKDLLEGMLKSCARIKEIEKILASKSSKNQEDKQDNKTAGRILVDENQILIRVDDHKEINPLFINFLGNFNLSGVSFDNVKVSGLDLSYSNAIIDPQKVYNKDMSNGNYSGLSFNSSNFEGVNICGSDFTDCEMELALIDKAIMDENTKLGNHFSLK